LLTTYKAFSPAFYGAWGQGLFGFWHNRIELSDELNGIKLRLREADEIEI